MKSEKDIGTVTLAFMPAIRVKRFREWCHLQLNRRLARGCSPRSLQLNAKNFCNEIVDQVSPYLVYDLTAKKPLPSGRTGKRCDGGSVPAGGRHLAFSRPQSVRNP